jgi:hypothetical protein
MKKDGEKPFVHTKKNRFRMDRNENELNVDTNMDGSE